MSCGYKPKSSMNYDTLTKTLRSVHNADYDHPMVGQVMYELAQMCEEDQKSIIAVALCKCKGGSVPDKYGNMVPTTYDELCGCVKKNFVIQKQMDDNGPFMALTYGKDSLSVATWDGSKYPMHAKDVKVTQLCMRSADGTLRCAPMLDFMELWMDQNKSSFKGFLSGLDSVTL